MLPRQLRRQFRALSTEPMDLKFFMRRSKVLRRYKNLLHAARLLQSDEIREQIRDGFRGNKDAANVGEHLAHAQTELHKLQALVATVGPRGPMLSGREPLAAPLDPNDAPSPMGEDWPWER